MAHTLTDGVVTLRAPVETDIDRITECCQDPAVQRFTTVPAPYHRSHAEGFVGIVAQGWEAGTDHTWAVTQAGVLHGMIGLHGIRAGAAEIGFWMGPDARGRGLLTRAIGLVLDHAFDPAGADLQVVEWRAFAGNWPSWRAVWRHGFRFDGVGRLGAAAKHGRVDDWMGSLLRGEPRTPRAPWPGLEDVRPTPPDRPWPWPADAEG